MPGFSVAGTVEVAEAVQRAARQLFLREGWAGHHRGAVAPARIEKVVHLLLHAPRRPSTLLAHHPRRLPAATHPQACTTRPAHATEEILEALHLLVTDAMAQFGDSHRLAFTQHRSAFGGVGAGEHSGSTIYDPVKAPIA